MRGQTVGSDLHTICSRLLEYAVGKSPVIDLKIGSVNACYFLDTGSQVSTLTESLIRKHLWWGDVPMLSTSGWFLITVGNDLDFPFWGYIELDVETIGLTVRECGLLVVKDPQNKNVCQALLVRALSRCRELIPGEKHFRTCQKWIVLKRGPLLKYLGRHSLHIYFLSGHYNG